MLFNIPQHNDSVVEWTRDNLIKQLKIEIRTAFNMISKCRDTREIYGSVRLWNNILEEGLEEYDKYGLWG